MSQYTIKDYSFREISKLEGEKLDIMRTSGKCLELHENTLITTAADNLAVGKASTVVVVDDSNDVVGLFAPDISLRKTRTDVSAKPPTSRKTIIDIESKHHKRHGPDLDIEVITPALVDLIWCEACQCYRWGPHNCNAG